MWKTRTPYILLAKCKIVQVCVLAQLHLTLCKPMDCSPPSFSIQEVSQARIMEWVAISFSRESPDSGIEPMSLALQAASLLLSHQRRSLLKHIGST